MTTSTIGNYWTRESGAVWRVCRKPFRCHGLGGSLPENQCSHSIQAGEKYLDTNQITTWPNTYRICSGCAAKPSKY